MATFCGKDASSVNDMSSHYVNVSVLIKFSQKKSVFFYLYYHKFSIKSYVFDVY